MKVLIIDDDKLVSLSLKTILEADSGIEIVGMGNSGEEAIAQGVLGIFRSFFQI